MRMTLVLPIPMASLVLLAASSWAQESAQEAPPITKHSPTAKVFSPPNHAATTPKVVEQYVIRCELIRFDEQGKPKPLAAPSIMLTEGQEGEISIQGERPFVTGVRRTEGGNTAHVVTKLTEGLTGKFTVTAIDGDSVHLDASITRLTINENEADVDPAADGTPIHSPVQNSAGWRVVRCVRIGESIIVTGKSTNPMEGEYIAKLVIDRLSADEASITPILTSEAAPDDNTDSTEFVTIVYQVGDLLARSAQDEGLDRLEDIDFMPVIDLVLSEALVTWPEEAQIRPFPKNGSLVVSQTQEAHQIIRRVLRDKRDNVAALKRLIK